MKSQILLVEDSTEYQKVIIRALSGHEIICVSTVDDAFQALGQREFDLILLDINLPQKPGFLLLSEIQGQSEYANIPILCITGKTEVSDKVTAFSLGADDYILKPFDPIELKARVESRIQKKKKRSDGNSLIFSGGLEINKTSHRVYINEENGRTEVQLTPTEFKLLCCLVAKPDRVFTRDQLLIAAWGEDASVLDRVVDVHLCTLRKKLKHFGRLIKAVAGVGYRFVPDSSKKALNKVA